MDYVMSIVVPTETCLDEDDVEYAVCRMDDDEDKQLVSNYIAYLKMVLVAVTTAVIDYLV